MNIPLLKTIIQQKNKLINKLKSNSTVNNKVGKIDVFYVSGSDIVTFSIYNTKREIIYEYSSIPDDNHGENIGSDGWPVYLTVKTFYLTNNKIKTIYNYIKDAKDGKKEINVIHDMTPAEYYSNEGISINDDSIMLGWEYRYM